jgi:DNA-binding LacI/PurR family transcriptional regulator
MARVTIDGLAQQLGISRAAVSYALNGQPGVSEATRARVLALAMELGWQANVSARSLSRSRADAVGLVLARPAEDVGAEPYYINSIAGMESAASELGVSLLLRFVPPDDGAEVEVYRRWHAEHRVDGVLLVDLRVDDRRPEALDRMGLPYFVHGGRRGDEGWQFDAHHEAALLVEHLAGLGHRRIGHVSGPVALLHETQRVAGLDQQAAARGVTVLHAEADYTDRRAAAATELLLDASPPPTAFVYSSDLMAVGGTTVLRRNRAAVVSWDDSVLCRTAAPSITALERDPYGAGRRSAQILLSRLAGDPEPPYEWDHTPLVVRESSTPVPTEERWRPGRRL